MPPAHPRRRFVRVEFGQGYCHTSAANMKLSPDQSLAGILEPVFAIRTEEDLGIGDTEGVRQMIDWCQRHRFNIFQTLPVNEISDDNSPYNAISSLAIEPTTIALTPEHLPGFVTEKIPQARQTRIVAGAARGAGELSPGQGAQTCCSKSAFESFLKRHFNTETDRAEEFRAFLQENADWLSDYALFRMLMEGNGGSPAWDRWTPEHRGPRRARTWLLSLPEPRRD